ncbi:MAG: hypothetical protein SGPRY_009558 [Prymnesium sp.]
MWVAPSPPSPTPSVGELIDALPLGRFHALLVARQIVLTACFALSLEITPYIFQGLELEFGVEQAALATVSTLFALGATIGAGLTSLQDEFGRAPVIRAGALTALLFASASIFMPSFALLLLLRVPLGTGFAFMQLGFGAWFSEFLPKDSRGPLYVFLTIGYPIGRAVAILSAWLIETTHWRWMLAEISMAISLAFVISLFIPESPRSLLILGDPPAAYRVLQDLYTFNGTPFPEAAKRAIHWDKAKVRSSEATPLAGKAKPSLWSILVRIVHRWQSLRHSQPKVLIFALVLFAGIALQQSLILIWGPHVFQQLLYPGSSPQRDKLPYSVLLGWNFADWGGIAFSSLLIDRLGRRGFFAVGFLAAAILWSALAVYTPILHAICPGADPYVALVVIGAFAQATRGFVPEAGNLWALETFPTTQRATMYAACNVVYHFTSGTAVAVTGTAQSASPILLLLGFAGLQILMGIFTLFLPKETSKVAMQDT